MQNAQNKAKAIQPCYVLKNVYLMFQVNIFFEKYFISY